MGMARSAAAVFALAVCSAPGVAHAHSPDCARNVGLASFVVFLAALLGAAFVMERRFGSDDSGALPITAWLGLALLALLAAALFASIGYVSLC